VIWRKPTLYGRDEGAVAVEAAITLSVLLMLIFGIIEFTVAFWQVHSMSLAVEQAGRYVMLSYATPTTTHCDTGCALTQMKGILTTAICTPPTTDNCITVSASPKSILLVPGTTPPTPSTNGMTLTASYGFKGLNFIGVGTFALSSGIWVPLD
jgi:hypothetical protein